MLLSFPARDVVEYRCNFSKYCFDCRGILQKCEPPCYASCFYTGDTSLKRDFDLVINHTSSVLRKYSDSGLIGIMQIPHHGSSYCYPNKIINDTSVCSAFVNYEPCYSQRIFDADIIHNFSNSQNYKPLFLITNNSSDELEIRIDLK